MQKRPLKTSLCSEISSLFYFLSTTTPPPKLKEMSRVNKKTSHKHRKNVKMGWRVQFKSSLIKCLHQHLRRTIHPRFGKRLLIVPFDCFVVRKIRLVLSWVVGGHVFHLNYWGVLHLFEMYCEMLFPNEYNHKLNGPVYPYSMFRFKKR